MVDLEWEPKFILDAGANIGLAARLFATLWPNSTIVALEPDHANFAMLQLNAAMTTTIIPKEVRKGVEIKGVKPFGMKNIQLGNGLRTLTLTVAIVQIH